MTNYDTLYKTEHLFGNPYPELIEFFRKYEAKGNLLDLGCGQGRNAIPLAKLGYTVTGIDHSKLGIEQMTARSLQEGLSVAGLVADIFQLENYQVFDVVLLDSMFHFTKKDKAKETALLRKITTKIKEGSILCVCIQNTGSKVKILKETILNCGSKVKVLNDTNITYCFHDRASGHNSETKYCMYIVSKE